jgi:carbamoyltransferase
VDFSSRIQTINKDQNELLYYILIEFKKITGLGILINTSFNQRGEPIVCSPEDAYNCFVNTKIDILVMGRFTYYDKNIKVNKNNFSLD